jgi:hypothetical protein
VGLERIITAVERILPEYYLDNQIKESEMGETYMMHGVAQEYTNFPKI